MQQVEPLHVGALEIHPDDAALRGIADGDEIRVWNVYGEVRVKARLTRDVKPGVVVLPKGLWSHQTLSGTTANAVACLALATGWSGTVRSNGNDDNDDGGGNGVRIRRGLAISPVKLDIKTAQIYSNALDEMDKKNKTKAIALFTQVAKAFPDFTPATEKLDRLQKAGD